MRQRRYAAGIPLTRNCDECGLPFELVGHQSRALRYCPGCRQRIAALYLATPLPVKLFCARVRVGDATLREWALTYYGRTRGDLSERERAELLAALTHEDASWQR